jgi:hypothetical protein
VLTTPAEYLRNLKTASGQSTAKVLTVPSATENELIVTVDSGWRRDVLRIDRATDLLRSARTYRHGQLIRSLTQFEYDQPLPAGIKDRIESAFGSDVPETDGEAR